MAGWEPEYPTYEDGLDAVATGFGETSRDANARYREPETRNSIRFPINTSLSAV